jgi:chromatin remodeling complex protein RSC6
MENHGEKKNKVKKEEENSLKENSLNIFKLSTTLASFLTFYKK